MQTTLILEDQDRDTLTRVLIEYLGDLRLAIRNTDSRTMREGMHRDEDSIKSILQSLGAELPAPGRG